MNPISTSKTGKRDINKFLFDVVNQLDLDEFKKYTNFRELMRNALTHTNASRMDALERYVDLNFEQNIPIELTWKKGGFVSLRLTSDFYESDTAARVFRNIFKIKKCSVVVVKLSNDLADKVHNSSEPLCPPKRRKLMETNAIQDTRWDNQLLIQNPSETVGAQQKKRKLSAQSQVDIPTPERKKLKKTDSTTLAKPSQQPSADGNHSQPLNRPTSRNGENTPSGCHQNLQPSECLNRPSGICLSNVKSELQEYAEHITSPHCTKNALSRMQITQSVMQKIDIQPPKVETELNSRLERDTTLPHCHQKITGVLCTSTLPMEQSQFLPQNSNVWLPNNVRSHTSTSSKLTSMLNNRSSTCLPKSSQIEEKKAGVRRRIKCRSMISFCLLANFFNLLIAVTSWYSYKYHCRYN